MNWNQFFRGALEQGKQNGPTFRSRPRLELRAALWVPVKYFYSLEINNSLIISCSKFIKGSTSFSLRSIFQKKIK